MVSLPRGRPTTYTDVVANEVCDRLSIGESLRQICRGDHMPSYTTILQWVTDDREGFYDQYVNARERQAEFWAEEILEIADDGSNDWMERETKNGDMITVLDHEHVQRSKLRVDARKWLMARMAPKRFGDKSLNVHAHVHRHEADAEGNVTTPRLMKMLEDLRDDTLTGDALADKEGKP